MSLVPIWGATHPMHGGVSTKVWRFLSKALDGEWANKWMPTPTTYKVISPQKDFGDCPMVSALIDIDTRR